ncbi:MAG: tRNA lysidine(34) synthetase TilS [Phycisphaerales bacterium]|jgi:tRNA(Ile)-lysidine synthase|nr:tRNA lysidine(34) synthetase TilS [Phycisphaerales bacterium]
MNKDAIPLEVRRHQLVASVRHQLGQNVLVGISGGADSTALLILCCAIASQQSSTLRVVAGHINHGIRQESDQEQALVESTCEKLGVPCFTKKITVEPIDGSLAAGARKGRYDALAEIALAQQLTTLAIAHHATDQLETMLMALCRGGGPRKLAGMAASRPLNASLTVRRPLLHADRAELQHICSCCNIPWCDDPTNNDLATPRGTLRQDVLPKLRELWPAADVHAANASLMLQAAADALDAQTNEASSKSRWERHTLAAFSDPIVAAILHRVIGERASFKTIRSIASAITDHSTNPKVFTCAADCVVHVTAHEVWVDQA